MTIEAVIFDLDGTITQPYLDFDKMREEMGLARDAEPILEALEGVPEAHRLKCLELLRLREAEAVDNSCLNPGARETLATLKTQGIPVAILTRNTQDNARRVLRRHDLTVDLVVGREEGPLKPDPGGVFTICRKLKAEPKKTLFVGDYLHDMLCAVAAGAIPVLLMSHGNAGAFRQHASFAIESLDEIVPIVRDYCMGGDHA